MDLRAHEHFYDHFATLELGVRFELRWDAIAPNPAPKVEPATPAAAVPETPPAPQGPDAKEPEPNVDAVGEKVKAAGLDDGAVEGVKNQVREAGADTNTAERIKKGVDELDPPGDKPLTDKQKDAAKAAANAEFGVVHEDVEGEALEQIGVKDVDAVDGRKNDGDDSATGFGLEMGDGDTSMWQRATDYLNENPGDQPVDDARVAALLQSMADASGVSYDDLDHVSRGDGFVFANSHEFVAAARQHIANEAAIEAASQQPQAPAVPAAPAEPTYHNDGGTVWATTEVNGQRQTVDTGIRIGQDGTRYQVGGAGADPNLHFGPQNVSVNEQGQLIGPDGVPVKVGDNGRAGWTYEVHADNDGFTLWKKGPDGSLAPSNWEQVGGNFATNPFATSSQGFLQSAFPSAMPNHGNIPNNIPIEQIPQEVVGAVNTVSHAGARYDEDGFSDGDGEAIFGLKGDLGHDNSIAGTPDNVAEWVNGAVRNPNFIINVLQNGNIAPNERQALMQILAYANQRRSGQ